MALDPTTDATGILAMEERALNAWPAAHTLHYDGWLLRLSDGYTRRANSVQALYPSTLDVTEKIAHCEQVYAAQGLDTVFKLTAAAQHYSLDARLAELGYSLEARTMVQVLPLLDIVVPGDTDTTFDAVPTERWLEAFVRLSGLDAGHWPAMQRLLAIIVPEHRFVARYEQGTITGVGLVVVERGFAGIYDVVVDPALRRQGIGTNLGRHLLHWASKQGAYHAYLQVVADNIPARRLYANLGFRDAYAYWYRVKKAPGVNVVAAAPEDG